MRRLDILELHYVEAEMRFDHRDLSGLHRKHGVLERLDHLAAAESAEVAALEVIRWILGIFRREFREVAAGLRLLEHVGRFELGRRSFRVGRAGRNSNQYMARMDLIEMSERGLQVAIVVILDLLVARLVVGRQGKRGVVDEGYPDSRRLAELLGILFVEVGDLIFGRRHFRAEIGVRYFDVAQSHALVAQVECVACFIVADLHARVDHVAQRVGDHLLTLAVFIFARQHIVAAQQFLVGVEVELAVALKCGRGGDLLLQRFVADADPEIDQPIQRLLPDIDIFQHRGGVGAVHLLQDLAEVGGLAIDLIGEYLIAVDSGDRMDSVEQSASAKAPERHGQREEGEGSFYLPRVLVTSDSF